MPRTETGDILKDIIANRKIIMLSITTIRTKSEVNITKICVLKAVMLGPSQGFSL